MSRRRWRAAALAALVLCLGCGHTQSMFEPAGGPARGIADLGWMVLVTFVVVMGIMFGIILWPALRRRRGRFDEHAPIDETGGQPMVFVGGFVIPFVILAVVLVAGIRTMHSYPLSDGAILAPEIRIIGHQWWWQVQYVAGPPHLQFETANEIHIPVGQPVDIGLASADVIHSFWVPRLHGKMDLIPGNPNQIRIEADRPGVYRGQCAEYCGTQHANMILLVVAETPEAYASWLERQRQPAAAPQTALARQGADVFTAKPCGLCHAIRGTAARGGVAPDLTHMASRRGLAANMLANNRANLAAWVVHAQSLKAGAMMPNVTQMTGRELQALVAYLEQLE